MTSSKSSDICCPKFNPKSLDNKTIVWKNKLFIQDNVKQLFHIPLNMGKVITRMCAKIDDAKASVKTKDFVMLAYDPSPWTSEIYMTVSKEVPGAKMIRLSGKFITKVFDGPYNAVPKWIKEMEEIAAKKNVKIKKHYFYYTTCPKCAKLYKHNYVVDFAEI